MITTYCSVPEGLRAYPGFVTGDHLARARWIDLFEPTPEEEAHAEQVLGVDLPTREEMRALEDSARLFEERGAVYLTATIIVNSEGEYPRTDDLSFVLTPRCLVTVRYATPKAVTLFAERASRRPPSGAADAVLLGLLDAFIERIALSIDRVGRELDDLVHRVLSPEHDARRVRHDYAAMLRQLERNQVLLARARASLASLHRLIGFVSRPTLEFDLAQDFRPRAATLRHDLQSLTDQTAFLANNLSFELAAILGMINIEQNGIIKIFSVAAVVFLPPTLVASIYGMNFGVMPELAWRYGYAWALGAMVGSAVVTYYFFKRRGWL
ncbi:MAG: magnesium transporter CorA family protein [Gammaproteobacteria bacterium]